MEDKTVSGQCHCGDVSYKVLGSAVTEFLCHCEDCRVLCAGGHLSGLGIQHTSVEVKGEPKKYNYNGGSGKSIESYFCGKCATPLFSYPRAYEGLIVVKANSIKSGEMFEPKVSLYPESAFDWDQSIIIK